MKMDTEIDTGKSRGANTNGEEEILSPPNVEEEEATADLTAQRFRFALVSVILYIFLCIILVSAPFVATAILAAGSSYCPLDPVIRYPCCEPDFMDVLITFPLFAGMLLTCSCFLQIVSERWMVNKFQKEGECIKGTVSDKRTWRTSHDKGTSCHCELIVKYPAEGSTLISPSCSHIVTKKFAKNTGLFAGDDYSSYNQMSTGSEIELLRMPGSDGYDPRKAIPVLRIKSNQMFYCQLCACLLFGIIWNIAWCLFSCIALFWSWPIAILLAYAAAGDDCFGLMRNWTFKKSGLDGDILSRYNQGEDTMSESKSDINQPPVTDKTCLSQNESDVNLCSLDCVRTIV